MNDNNSLPDKLPETTHSFQFDLVGNVSKKRYMGEFSCKIPTIKDQAMIAKFEAMLNGEFPVYLNQGVLNIHKKVAYLKYTLTESPKFWRESEGGYNLMDPNIIDGVYDEVMAFEEKWYKTIWGEPGGEAEGDTSEEKA